MKKLLILFLFIFSLPVWAEQPYRFFFNGAQTSQKVFNDTGILVMSDNAKQFINVNNSIAKYAVMLPYSDKWIFDYEGGHFKGNAGNYNFDFQIWGGDETPEQHLQAIMKYLKNDAPLTDDSPELIYFYGETVLRSEIDFKEINTIFKGVKQLHFYSVKKREKTLYKLHFSVVVAPEKSKKERDFEQLFLAMVTKGFFLE